jgi:hypothetical protein
MRLGVLEGPMARMHPAELDPTHPRQNGVLSLQEISGRLDRSSKRFRSQPGPRSAQEGKSTSYWTRPRLLDSR